MNQKARIILRELNKYNNPVILETGCIRHTSIEMAQLDGGSTYYIANWVKQHGGRFYSIDNKNTDKAEKLLKENDLMSDNIIFKNTTASSITQFDVGFTAGGGEIVGNGTITGNAEGSFTILQRVEDFDAADEIFFDANSFNGSTLILYIKMSRIF